MVATPMVLTPAQASLLSFLLITVLGILIHKVYTSKLARRSLQARQAILKNLGIPTTSNPKFIGFFHPYWYLFSIQGLGRSIDETYVVMQAVVGNVCSGLL
jgi:hypothetical protein